MVAGLPAVLIMLSWPLLSYGRGSLVSAAAALGVGLSTAVLQNFESFRRPRNQTSALAICIGIFEVFLYFLIIQSAVIWTRRRFWPFYGLGRCANCGYQLRGLENPRCPECGHAFDPRLLQTPGKGSPHD